MKQDTAITENTPIRSTVGRTIAILLAIISATYLLTSQLFTIQHQIQNTQVKIETLGSQNIRDHEAMLTKIEEINQRTRSYAIKRMVEDSEVFLARKLAQSHERGAAMKLDEQELRMQLRDILDRQ